MTIVTFGAHSFDTDALRGRGFLTPYQINGVTYELETAMRVAAALEMAGRIGQITDAASSTAADRQAVHDDRALVAQDRQVVYDDRVLAETARIAAQGYAAGLNLPALAAADAGKPLTVSVGGTGYTLSDALRLIGVAGGTNCMSVTSSNGGAPIIAVAGPGANIDLQMSSKGSGGLYLGSTTANQVLIRGPALAARMVEFNGAVAGGNPTIGTTGGALSIASPALAKQAAVAYAATVTLDFGGAQNFVVGDLTGPLTLANPASYPVGQSGEIWIKQDATGNRTVSAASAWVKMGSGAVALGAGKWTCIAYSCKVAGAVHYSIIGGA